MFGEHTMPMNILIELLDSCQFTCRLKHAPMVRASGNTGNWFTASLQSGHGNAVKINVFFLLKKVKDLISINIFFPI